MRIILLAACMAAFTGYTQQFKPLSAWSNSLASMVERDAEMLSLQPLQLSATNWQTELQQALLQSRPELQYADAGLTVVYERSSRMGKHILFQQTFKGKPVWGATIKVNLNHALNPLSTFSNLVLSNGWTNSATPSGGNHWVMIDGKPEPASAAYESGNYIIRDVYGNEMYKQDAHLYVEDTTISGRVFRPDPLTPISVVYGQNGTYKHFNDSNYALLNDQRVAVTFPGTFEGGQFKLNNQFVRLVDVEPPFIAAPQNANGNFDFLRGNDAFKDVMVSYHISNLQQHLYSLGIDAVNFPIKVDPHAGTGDNSSFLPTDTVLRFGSGGVPDAEDADVITHEFTHALSFMIVPSINMSQQRRAIEEGLCDVQAALYSKKYAPFNWRKLYNWDAPNPVVSGETQFWPGRNGASTKTMANISNNPYSDCEIWTSTILDIAEQIGDDSTLVLMFASMANYTDNTTMPQAAQLFMQADSVVMNEAFGWKIGPVFNARGMGNFPTSVEAERAWMDVLKVYNTIGFANGTEPAYIELPVDAIVSLVDMQGKTIRSSATRAGRFEVFSTDLQKGLYVLTVATANTRTSVKLIRY